MADLKLIIKALFEGGENIDNAKEKIGELGGAAEETEEVGSRSFGDFQDNVAIAMLGINQAIEVGMKLAEAARLAYEGTVGKALEAAGEVEELMRVSGDAPETLSALRLEAEKADVPFDDLYKAMQNLNENGIAPTVDNLVAIADEYVNLQDPLEKAKLLTENFGEAGDEIAPMLENIAGGVKEVQDAGLIFTEEEIQAAKDYEVALADLGLAFDSFKVKIGKAVIPALTEVFNNLAGDPTEMANLFDDLYAAADKALFAGSIGADTWQLIIKDATTVTGSYSEQVEKLKFHLGILNDMNGDATNSTEELTVAEQAAADAAMAAALAQAAMAAELENITSLGGNYKGIIDLAYKYTDILEDITEQETIMANNPIGSEKYEEAKGKVEELKASMTELANRVTLDMFQATIAIGGVTETELAAYMQMAIDMGYMSEEGAQAAIEAYGNAMDTINGYAIDEKTGNVSIDAVAAFLTLDLLQAYALKDKEAKAIFRVQYEFGVPGDWQDEHDIGGPQEAVGGAVNAGNPYNWQEYGYRGEVFVPSADGFVLSRADAERALARALYGGGSAVDPDRIGKAVAQAMSGVTSSKKGGNVYNLTMPTSSNPADIRTAFELMEAWA